MSKNTQEYADMPDQTTQVAPGTQANPSQVDGSTPANAIPTDQQQPGTGAQSQADDASDSQGTSNLTLDQALRELARVRREAAEHRTARRTLEQEKADAERAKLTREERLAADLTDAERVKNELTVKYQERMLAYEVQLQAQAMGIVDPDAAVKLLDASRIEYADDGSPKNLAALLKELTAAKPYLVSSQAGATPVPNVNPTNPANATNRTTRYTDRQIAAMSPDEYKQHRAAIIQASREGRILPG